MEKWIKIILILVIAIIVSILTGYAVGT
ncbi:Protein of unknown function [Bacillus mycoides]|nr:Protein of unknown function [Bacillus mycoides]